MAGQVAGHQFLGNLVRPLRREIPLLATLHSEWSARGFSVIGVAVEHRAEVAAFARDFKIAYPLLVGEQDALDVAAKFGVVSPAFPFTVFTDKRGRVVALYLGELHRAQADSILSTVQNLNRTGSRCGGAARHRSRWTDQGRRG